MAWFLLGLVLGVLLAIPLAVLATRRTERRVRRLEKRARAAQRLAELGTLTGGLAHEIKNPLSAVGMNIQLVQEDLRDLTADPALDPRSPAAQKLPRIARRIESLWRETQRLRDILDDFLRFAGRMKLDLGPTDVNALIEDLVDFFQPQIQAAGIRLRTQLAAQPATARADPALLKQALLNLLINATQAVTEAREARQAHSGGTPAPGPAPAPASGGAPGNAAAHPGAPSAAPDAGELIIRTERARALGQDELLIHIIDTGPGIAPDQLERIFQPYFSTKKAGTGLGLPTTRRIVEEHGGTITVHSEPGKGSDFVIALPAPPPAERPREAEE